MRPQLKITEIAAIVQEREHALNKETDIKTVKRILRHIADLMAEEWRLNYDLRVAECLRRNGMGRSRNPNTQ